MNDQLVLVEKLRRSGAYDEALALCGDIVSEAPDDPDPLILAAAISRDAGRPDLGLPLLEHATALAPDRADLFCDLAALLLELGEDAGAEEAYARAVAADSASRTALLGLIDLYETQGRIGEAVSSLGLLVGQDETVLETRERLARLLDLIGDDARAADVRRETMRHAQDTVREAFGRIREHSSDTPIYEVDEARLSWSYAVLTYAAAGADLARSVERTDPKAAVQSYRSMLQVLADAAEQAQTVDGLRRTYEAAAQAFAHCHAKLADLQETFGNLGGAIYHLEEAVRARRTPSTQDHARLGELAVRCAPDIAGIRDAVAEFHRKMPPPAAIPITRWDFVRHGRDWLDVAAKARKDLAIGSRRITVVALNAHHIQVFFAVACVLFARGHAIDFLWMPCLQFERDCDPEPAYDRWDEALLAHEMSAFAAAGLPAGFRLIDLRSIALSASSADLEAFAERQAFTDLRNTYRNSSIDIAAEPMKTANRNRAKKNLDAMRRMRSYLNDQQVDRLILFNAGVMEYGGLFHVARDAGIAVVEWEQGGHRRGEYIVSINRTHGEFDLANIWQSDAPHALSDARRARIREWMAAKDKQAALDPVPRGRLAPDPAAQSLLAGLGLDPSLPTAALFPNITWDTAALDRDRAFTSVADWVLRTVAFFAEHPDWQLVVRSHPEETVHSEEFVGEIIRNRWPVLPANVQIVDSESPLSSYRLLDACQLGLYYTGTLGLEMAMAGILGISPARPLFGGMGFTREMHTAEDYFDAIRCGFEDPEAVAVTEAEMALAWCFADLYMNDASQSLPWSYQKFWPSILEDWPMERVLGPEGQQFARVFAAFAGEIDLPDGIVGNLGDEVDSV